MLPKTQKIKKIEIIRFPIFPRGNSNFIRLGLNYISYIISQLFFGLFFRKKFGKIFFVYATSPIFQAIPAIIFGKIFKIKIVLWVQDLWPHNLEDTGYIKNKFLLKIIDLIVIQIYNYADLILCQSDAFTNYINKKTKTKVRTFYNPSNFKFYKFQNRNKYFDIYYTGNLGKGQNLEKIIDIFQNDKILAKKIRLIIYGSGKNFQSLKEAIKKNKLTNVVINKPVNPEKLRDKMRNANSFLLKLNNGPGLSKTLPAKFQTYVSFGKPILSINNGIVSKFVTKYGLGISCKKDSYHYLLRAILNLRKLSNKKLEIIEKNSQKLFFSEFEINNSCKKLKKYLEEDL